MSSHMSSVDAMKAEACAEFLENLPQIYRDRLFCAFWKNFLMPSLPMATFKKMPHPASVRFHLHMEQLKTIRDRDEMDQALTQAEQDIAHLAHKHSSQQQALYWIRAFSKLLGAIFYGAAVFGVLTFVV